MSWDLLVASHLRPSDAFVDGLLKARAHSFSRLTESNVSTVIARRTSGGGDVFIEGPVPAGAEDLPLELASAILAPKFLVTISCNVPATAAEMKLAESLAKHIASSHNGAVYDPQSERIVGKPSRAAPIKKTQNERIRAISLAWYFASLPNADELLQQLRLFCSKALPHRYGPTSPYRHLFEERRGSEFVALWDKQAREKAMGGVSWSASSPCFGGHVSFPDQLTGTALTTRPCTVLRMYFDGRAPELDPRWTDAITALFQAVALKLHAFYGAAFVQRNAIAGRGLFFDGESEPVPAPASNFTGLIPIPTWLTWFGPEYSSLLRAKLDGYAIALGDSLYVQGGERPMDADELKGRVPILPSEFVRPIDDKKKCAEVLPNFG